MAHNVEPIINSTEKLKISNFIKFAAIIVDSAKSYSADAVNDSLKNFFKDSESYSPKDAEQFLGLIFVADQKQGGILFKIEWDGKIRPKRFDIEAKTPLAQDILDFLLEKMGIDITKLNEGRTITDRLHGMLRKFGINGFDDNNTQNWLLHNIYERASSLIGGAATETAKIDRLLKADSFDFTHVLPQDYIALFKKLLARFPYFEEDNQAKNIAIKNFFMGFGNFEHASSERDSMKTYKESFLEILKKLDDNKKEEKEIIESVLKMFGQDGFGWISGADLA